MSRHVPRIQSLLPWALPVVVFIACGALAGFWLITGIGNLVRSPTCDGHAMTSADLCEVRIDNTGRRDLRAEYYWPGSASPKGGWLPTAAGDHNGFRDRAGMVHDARADGIRTTVLGIGLTAAIVAGGFAWRRNRIRARNSAAAVAARARPSSTGSRSPAGRVRRRRAAPGRRP